MFFRNLIRFSGGFFGKLEAMVAEYKRTLDLEALRIKADALICDNREEIRAGSVIPQRKALPYRQGRISASFLLCSSPRPNTPLRTDRLS